MSRLRQLWHRALAVIRHRLIDRDLREELGSHLRLAADDYEQSGMTPEAARREAALKLGGFDATVELHRDTRSLPTVESVMRDVAYALRSLRRERGVAFAAIAILAIGIGANTAVFSVVNPLLLRPLPFRDAKSLVWITNTGDSGLSGVTHHVNVYEALSRQSRSIEDWTAYFAFFGFGNYTLTGHGEAERLAAVEVAPRFFELLGIQPALGRGFAPEEWVPKGRKAALLTHPLWQRRFGGDPAIVGQTLTINNEPVLIVGVLPSTFDFSAVFAPGTRVDLLMPAILDDMRGWGNTLAVIGRLRNGASVDQAQAELDALVKGLREAHADWGNFGARVTELRTHVTGRMRQAAVVLWSAVGLVLLIVCANLSNLLLARTASRTKEFAVRLALGASRARVMQQLLCEGIVLSFFGAAVGVPLAYALTGFIKAQSAVAIPLLSYATVDGTALLVTGAIALATGLTFGALPAIRVSRRDPQEALQERSRGSTDGRRHRWMRSALVVSEVALAVVLLIGAGLLLRSFVHVLDVNLGFAPSRATAVRFQLRADVTEDARTVLLGELTSRVAALHGVETAGFTDALPLDRNRAWTVGAPGRAFRPDAFVYVVSPGYLRAMGIRLRAGRDFSGDDTSKRPLVLIVNEMLVRTLYPGQDPVGQTALLGDTPLTIIGVVDNVRQSALVEEPTPQMYLTHTQGGRGVSDLVVRSTLPTSTLAPALRNALADLAPRLVVTEFRPLDDLVDRAVSPRRFLLSLIAGFSAIALFLASLGIYGVVSYGVTQRTQEIGVRMALGASGRDVRRHVLGETLRLAGIGTAGGILASLALTRLFAALLFDTSPTDVATYVGTAILITAVAALAGYVPALRASRIEPIRALRAE